MNSSPAGSSAVNRGQSKSKKVALDDVIDDDDIKIKNLPQLDVTLGSKSKGSNEQSFGSASIKASLEA